MHSKVLKKAKTEVKKTRKALEQIEAAKLKKENLRIVTYKRL